MDKDYQTLVRCLIYAVHSYIHWHDEFHSEEDFKAVKRMNNAMQMMRDLLDQIDEKFGMV